MNRREFITKLSKGIIAIPLGGLFLKAGTVVSGMEYVATAKDANIRLIPFVFPDRHSYIIEAGNHYFRFYANGKQETSGGFPVEMPTPYKTADIFDLVYSQINKTLYFAHKNHPAYKLNRTSRAVWTLNEVEFKHES